MQRARGLRCYVEPATHVGCNAVCVDNVRPQKEVCFDTKPTWSGSRIKDFTKGTGRLSSARLARRTGSSASRKLTMLATHHPNPNLQYPRPVSIQTSCMQDATKMPRAEGAISGWPPKAPGWVETGVSGGYTKTIAKRTPKRGVWALTIAEWDVLFSTRGMVGTRMLPCSRYSGTETAAITLMGTWVTRSGKHEKCQENTRAAARTASSESFFQESRTHITTSDFPCAAGMLMHLSRNKF